MPLRLIQLWDTVRSSYWFFPLLLSIAAFALAIFTYYLDLRFGRELLEPVPWLYLNQPEGAREVLSTIAGSMITVAGVTFSITVVAVVHASGQYGPRLLTNFMRDTGNQITLGTFIATFLYSLQVLRTVRSGDEGNDVESFVPHFGVLGALVLALCSIGVLIYFIHHVPRSIHISHVIARIGEELKERIEDQFPENLGLSVPSEVKPREEEPEDFSERSMLIEAGEAGYIQAIDEERLFSIAEDNDLILHILNAPGNFIRPYKAIVEAYPGDRITQEIREKIQRAYIEGRKRTPVQDYMFLVDELVEIASRALSPGVNDPFTAVNCLDWLGSGVATFAKRDVPDAQRYNKDGDLRIITHPITFEEFCEAALGQIRPYAAGDRIAGMRLMAVIGELAEVVTSVNGRSLLRQHALRLMESAEKQMQDPPALELLRARHQETMSALRSETKPATAEHLKWVEGGN